MGHKVIVVRPFVFSAQPSPGQRLVSELRIAPVKNADGAWLPTEVELPPHVAEHPWIKTDFADGCIERPEMTAERVAREKAKKKAEDEENTKQLALAQQAMKRATGATVAKATEEDVARDLNTPVNELRANRGKDIGDKAATA
jgi:hypothetical protein